MRLLDGAARQLIGPVLDRLGEKLSVRGVSADAMTFLGFGLGLFAAAAIVTERYWLALGLILASRLCDGLDGAIARHTAKTDRGGFLDIVLDFAFYGLIPLAFVLARPAENSVAGAVLLASFYVNGASFLAYALIAERRGLQSSARGEKSLYFTTGLAETTETIAVFCLFCLFPGSFSAIAYAFAAVCLITTASRILLAIRVFRKEPPGR